MSVFSSGLGWLKRHKGKIAVAGGVVGGFVVLNRYLTELERNWDQSAVKDYVSEVRKKETHFENTLQTCNSTVFGLAPRVLNELDKLLHIDSTLAKLRENPHQKELWAELRICILSRVTGEIYSLSFFVSFLRVQLSVIAGYQYVDSGKNGSQPVVINKDIQMYYLSLLENFFNKGIKELLEPIENAAEEATRDITFDQMVSFQDLKDIFEKIKNSMSFFLSASDFNIGKYLIDENRASRPACPSTSNGIAQEKYQPLSPKDMEIAEKMLQETQDLLESEDCKKVIKTTIDVGYSIMMDVLFSSFGRLEMNESSSEDVNFANLHQKQVPFAKILPVLHHTLSEKAKSEEQFSLVRHLLCLDVINCFAANIYEAFCNI